MKIRNTLAALLLSCTAATAWAAAPACSFKWDASAEVELYRSTATPLPVGSDATTAPPIQAGRLYALELKPQGEVHYSVAPSKKMLADGAYGGVLRLKVPAAGQYRIAIDSGYWLDVIHAGKPVDTVDFNGSPTCDGPRKIVVFDLPADTDLLLQLSAASGAQAKLTVTRVAKAN